MRIWSFKTANFEVFCEAEVETDVDLSWADAETLDLIDRGVYDVICWHVGVHLCDGQADGWDAEIGSSWLGNSVYENPRDFVHEHRGVRAAEREHFALTGVKVSMGCYLPEMVREAIGEARRFIRRHRHNSIVAMPRVRGDA